MKYAHPKMFAVAGLLLLLAGCDDHSSSSTPTPTSTPVATTPQASISSQFATYYNASPNSLPVIKPSQTDLPAVSLTASPIALH